jgi:hypothetical protein
MMGQSIRNGKDARRLCLRQTRITSSGNEQETDGLR